MRTLDKILIGVVALTIGGNLYFAFHQATYGGKNGALFGGTGYPAAIDTTATLPNPNPTDSVAVVSHSALHTSENGAIEAVETKVGTGASTPTANTVLFGNGVGSSAWSGTPTLSTITTTGLATLAGFISTASSTVIGNFTITGNSTSTNATTTSLFTTTASTTNLFVSTGPCSGLNALNVNASGQLTCGAVSTGGTTFLATTSAQNLATTTIDLTSCTNKRSVSLQFETGTLVGSGATSSAEILFALGNDLSANYSYSILKNNSAVSNNTVQQFVNITNDQDSGSGGRATHQYITLQFTNPVAPLVRFGNWQRMTTSTSSSPFMAGTLLGSFMYLSTSQVSNVEFWLNVPNVLFATSTQIFTSCN